MIIWINGAFGSGKSQTAYELNKRIENSYVFDPEEAGFYIRSNLPSESKQSDFQSYPMWRSFNISMLEYISNNYSGIVICPMTITNEEYMHEFLDTLKDKRNDVKHYTLLASAETLNKRLKGRGERKGTWCFQQIERCVECLSRDAFEKHIVTDNMTIEEVVEAIASDCNIELLEDRRSSLKKRLDRFFVWKNHIRLFG